MRLQHFMSWVTLAIKPIEDEGQGYTLKKAKNRKKEVLRIYQPGHLFIAIGQGSQENGKLCFN